MAAPEDRDGELRDLNRKFEDLLRKCEKDKERAAKEGEEVEGKFPEWYRPPESGVQSWLSDPPLQKGPVAQVDRLAAVIHSLDWPSRGGFNWSVCLPTGKSALSVAYQSGPAFAVSAWASCWLLANLALQAPAQAIRRYVDAKARDSGAYLRRILRSQLHGTLSVLGALRLALGVQQLDQLLWETLSWEHQLLFGMAAGHSLVALWEDFSCRHWMHGGLDAKSLPGVRDPALLVLKGWLLHHLLVLVVMVALLLCGRLAGLGLGLLWAQLPCLLLSRRDLARLAELTWLRHRAQVAEHWRFTYIFFLVSRAPVALYVYALTSMDLTDLSLPEACLLHGCCGLWAAWSAAALPLLEAWSRLDGARALLLPEELELEAGRGKGSAPLDVSAKPLREVEVAELRSAAGLWLAIDGVVYDLSDFSHPGGEAVLKQWAGQDASAEFHRACPAAKCPTLEPSLCRYQVGALRLPPEEYRIFEHPEEEQQMRKLLRALALGLLAAVAAWALAFAQLQGAEHGGPNVGGLLPRAVTACLVGVLAMLLRGIKGGGLRAHGSWARDLQSLETKIELGHSLRWRLKGLATKGAPAATPPVAWLLAPLAMASLLAHGAALDVAMRCSGRFAVRAVAFLLSLVSLAQGLGNFRWLMGLAWLLHFLELARHNRATLDQAKEVFHKVPWHIVGAQALWDSTRVAALGLLWRSVVCNLQHLVTAILPEGLRVYSCDSPVPYFGEKVAMGIAAQYVPPQARGKGRQPNFFVCNVGQIVESCLPDMQHTMNTLVDVWNEFHEPKLPGLCANVVMVFPSSDQGLAKEINLSAWESGKDAFEWYVKSQGHKKALMMQHTSGVLRTFGNLLASLEPREQRFLDRCSTCSRQVEGTMGQPAPDLCGVCGARSFRYNNF
ncbi:unnamed protein product [Effrenium voratum]|nr:unnamed protein product [Effrenium voratum]